MREIKFRVWNKVLGEYINKDYHKKYYLNFDGVLCSFSDFGLVLPLDMKNYILEQYTGLVDKNGVEIYEGDIVNGWLYSNCEVKFGAYWNKEQYEDSISGYGWYIQKIGDSVLTITGLNEDSVEVIGNIHNDK